MTTTIAEIYHRAARKLGSRTGIVQDGSTTTAVLGGLIGTTGDNTFYAGNRLMFLDIDITNRERLIREWADVTGTATMATTTDHSDEPYILSLREDYTLNEYDEAFKKALRETRRTYRQVIPFTPLLTTYPMTMDWLRGAADIDAVFYTLSPLMLHNEDFSLWEDGPTSAPDGYTLEGAGAVVARVAGIRSAYAARLTAPGGNAVRLTQGIPGSLSQWLTRRTFPVFTPMRGAMWAETEDASAVRTFIRYTDSASGVPVTTYAYSDYIAANGRPEFPTLSLDINANLSDFEWGVEVAAGQVGTVSWAGMMQSTIDFDNSYSLKDSGGQAVPYLEFESNYRTRNVGGLPVVELQSYPATYGQVVVYCRRPFAALEPEENGYDQVVDDQYARVLEAGLLKWMLESIKPNQDRARLDRILATETSVWNRFNSNITDLPVPRPPRKYTVTGV